ncbi:MAG TPA: hypothetical protein VEY95_17275 [Azospirillaceae bacterium]|nr:hypothetical protein [Azospirillaceae bacterium]
MPHQPPSPRGPTAYFLGAGASAAQGVPTTEKLGFGIAHYVRECQCNRDDPVALASYLTLVHGVGEDTIARMAGAWTDYLRRRTERLPGSDGFPSLIELLSILDLSIAKGLSFGPSERRRGRAPATFEFDTRTLADVREELTNALVFTFHKLRSREIENRYDEFLDRLAPGDTLITTNWDTYLDFAMAGSAPGRRVDYGIPEARVSLRRGPAGTDTPPAGQPPLLKLHGSLNWLFCPRCANLHVNMHKDIASFRGSEAERRRWPSDRYCGCGAEMDAVIVAPSFVKTYGNPHLARIWTQAQKALEAAPRWVFIGYSLPSDDLEIRAMLLRALATRRIQAAPPAVEVYTAGSRPDLEGRYADLLRGCPMRIDGRGFEGFIEGGGGEDQPPALSPADHSRVPRASARR